MDNSKSHFKVFNFEKLIEKIVNNSEKILRKYGINISLFIDFSGNMYGDKKGYIKCSYRFWETQ